MISFREESTKNGCRTSPVALGTGLYTSVALPSRNVPRTFPEPSCRQSRFTLSLAHSLLRGLFRWSLAVLFAVGAWHLYLWSPLPGLVAIGITPVLAIFFFFRGLNLVSRTLPYWKTRRLIRKLGMRPTWWNTGAGYLLIDERQGSWIINGTAGMIVDIKRLHGHSDWQMHRLDLYTTDTPKPTASYGFGSAEEIREAAKIFQKAYAPQEKRDLPVTFADLRKKENKASEAH